MPSYSFKERFVPFVKDFTKRQTIRGIRKHPGKPGSIISHFTGSRFKPVRIIEKQPCIGVDTIFILEEGAVVVIEVQILTVAEANWYLDQRKELLQFGTLASSAKDNLAWNDGFRMADKPTEKTGCFDLMFRWWKQTHALPFAGHLIKW